MSTQRLNQVMHELIGLMGELQSIQQRVVPLVEELQDLGAVPSPEMKAMLLAMKPNKVKVRAC